MASYNSEVERTIVDPLEFRAAMRELAAGVAVITSGSGTRRRGITATALCSLSIEPPTVLVCINRNAECHQTILDHDKFCVNLLGSEDEIVANRFAGRTDERGAERFSFGRWGTLHTGAPVYINAIASFDCTLREAINAGTHSILLGDVKAVAVSTSRAALVYRAGRFALVE